MNAGIFKSRYKILESVVLENDFLRVEIVPDAGARTTSLIYKPENIELLWQNDNPEHAPVQYAQPFPDGEKAGFDEMFPTINECKYPDYPWKGVTLPDHGEVWALPWAYRLPDSGDSGAGRVSFSVHGVRLPYRFTKKLWLEEACLKAVYKVENLSPFSMPFVYASHPLFNVDAGDEIIVPDNLHAVFNAVPSDTMPEYGKKYEFPVDQDLDLSIVPPKSPGGYKKYYFTEKNTEGWSALRRRKGGFDIRMSVDAEQLPWLGIWMNEGGWDNQYNLALEPASASMDDPAAARKFNAESVLKPFETREWKIDIEIQT